jgi:hypothetical protein
MHKEIEEVERNNTWELVNLPHRHRPIGLKWVYKLKKNEPDEVIKHKARLVARGSVQQGCLGRVACPPHGRKISLF